MNLNRVIAYIEECRDTHVECVDYFDEGKTVWDWVKESGSLEEALGTRTFHQDCVEGYDEIIDYLRSLDAHREGNKAG